MAVRPPVDLVNLLSRKRVIPFVGAGFSAGLGLPGWNDLLEKVATDVLGHSDEDVDYERLYKDAGEDFLRVAEYLYVRSGGNIGPLRHAMSSVLRTDDETTDSSPHVELLNLGAPQVYTTNFDEMIEGTFYALEQPVEVVVLPKDVAIADARQTQVVKYHGDLRFDETLVVTESQYWSRLDFESPMDLKFRSDILGRSVLFMGYSFSDINIRVIWFKLMQMMRDVPEKDRLPSYIVRLDPNPVLEALFAEVGLRTIVLDPEGSAQTDSQKVDVLSDFLATLSSAASRDGKIPGTDQPMFASKRLLTSLTEMWQTIGAGAVTPDVIERADTVFKRRVPAGLVDEARQLLVEVCKEPHYMALRLAPDIAKWGIDIWGPSDLLTSLAIRAFSGYGRAAILDREGVPWKELWSAHVSDEVAFQVIRDAEYELQYHESSEYLDDDLAYQLDPVVRLANGDLTTNNEVKERARQLVDKAAALYPAVAHYSPDSAGPPIPTSLLREIEMARSRQADASSDERLED